MADKYLAEKGVPTFPRCGKSHISLTFNGHFLTMSGNGNNTYKGISGTPVEKGRRHIRLEFDYSVGRQKQPMVGPIPAGNYWVQPSQMWTNRWYKIGSFDAWGNHRITINVYPGTETYGRGGFFIHGGEHLGTAGCINLHAAMEQFVVDLEAATKDSPECYIPLTVRY
jgi:hypothetical protein